MDVVTASDMRTPRGAYLHSLPSAAAAWLLRYKPPRAITLVLALALAVLVPAVSLAEKTDILVLKNGDQITGEIKSLDRGKLSYSTDAMSTLSIEWEDVVRLTSIHIYLFELQGGAKYFGTLVQPAREGVLAVGVMGSVQELAFERVVSIMPIKQTFWTRLNGSLSFGFSFTKASQVAQLTVDGKVKYRGRTQETGLGLNSIITSTEDDQITRRFDIDLSHSRLLEHKWVINTTGVVQRNDELGLNLRTSVTPALRYHLIQTNASTLAFGAGLSVNREWASDGTETNNLEGAFSVNYELFFYNTPKTDLTASLDVYPSLTTSGRVRSEFNVSLQHELIKDFFWNLTYNQSRDSQPATEGAAKNDYSIVTSLGWSFG